MKYKEYKKMVLKDLTVKKEYDALQREFDAAQAKIDEKKCQVVDDLSKHTRKYK